MDWLVQMKATDLMLKFLRGEPHKAGGYPYQPQKRESQRGWRCEKPLPRSAPEEQGVPSLLLREFVQELLADAQCRLHTMMLLRHGKVIAECGVSPWQLSCPQMVYSMTKSVTGTAVGIAVGEGLLSLTDRVADIFPERLPPLHSSKWNDLRIHHLLTMTAGVRFAEVGSVLERDWARAYMESDFDFAPGERFAYNSMNSYMLAAAVCRRSGVSLVEYLTPRLFAPLGLTDVQWETCPMGVEKGGWGLYLRTEDMAKLGLLYANGGRWEGESLLPEDFVRDAMRVHIRDEERCAEGYGYQMWGCPMEGAFQFNGLFGQYVVIHPRLDMVLVMTGGSSNLFGTGVALRIADRFFGDAAQLSERPLRRSGRERRALERALAAAAVLPPLRQPDETGKSLIQRLLARRRKAGEEYPYSPAARRDEERMEGKRYALDCPHGGVLPMILQAVHGNYARGLSALALRFQEEALCLTLEGPDGGMELRVGMRGRPLENLLDVGGERYRVFAEGRWEREQTGLLRIWLFFIETPDTRTLTLRFSGKEVSLEFDEIPSAAEAVQLLYEQMGSDPGPLERMIREGSFAQPVHSFVKERMQRMLHPTGSGAWEEAAQAGDQADAER